VSVRFLADADLNHAIVQGVRLREPAVDFKSAHEANLAGLPDDDVLEIAAQEGRVLVSHDKRTMPVHFAARISQSRASPGVLLAVPNASVAEIVECLLVVWSASPEGEWADQIHYLPSFERYQFDDAGRNRSNLRTIRC